MTADISDAETEAAFDSAELAGMVESNPELAAMPELLEADREIAGRYRIIRHLGSGGMGNVYLAEHMTIGKQVAIKTLSLEFARRKVLRERFLREARSASQIRHPNVVDITDFGSTKEGAPFLVMEFLEGEDLKQTLEREGRLPFGRAREITVQICRALQAAHDKGIVHRDVKPANCFRIEQARGPDIVKVVDFGIAKTTVAEADSTELTKTGVIVGTAAFMSPEQARGESDLDARADVYSLGIILFRMLTGEMPFSANTPLGMITKHLTDPVPSLREVAPEARLTTLVDAIVRKALAKERDERWQSAAELAEALRKVDTDEAKTIAVPSVSLGSRVGVWVGAGVAALAAVAVAVYMFAIRPNAAAEAAAESPPEPAVLAQPEAEAEAEPKPEPEPAPVEATTVAVALVGAPEGARVLIDGEDRGPASEPLTLDKGDATVSIEVTAPGYASETVAFVPVADLELPIALDALPEPSTAKKRPRPKKKVPKDDGPKIDKDIGI